MCVSGCGFCREGRVFHPLTESKTKKASLVSLPSPIAFPPMSRRSTSSSTAGTTSTPVAQQAQANAPGFVVGVQESKESKEEMERKRKRLLNQIVKKRRLILKGEVELNLHELKHRMVLSKYKQLRRSNRIPSAYEVFMKKRLSELQSIPGTERIQKVRAEWAAMSAEEKRKYAPVGARSDMNAEAAQELEKHNAESRSESRSESTSQESLFSNPSTSSSKTSNSKNSKKRSSKKSSPTASSSSSSSSSASA